MYNTASFGPAGHAASVGWRVGACEGAAAVGGGVAVTMMMNGVCVGCGADVGSAGAAVGVVSKLKMGELPPAVVGVACVVTTRGGGTSTGDPNAVTRKSSNSTV